MSVRCDVIPDTRAAPTGGGPQIGDKGVERFDFDITTMLDELPDGTTLLVVLLSPLLRIRLTTLHN